MAVEIFNRYEQKYLLDDKVFCAIKGELAKNMEPDEHSKDFSTYTITNLYYDTPDNHLIRTSLSKPKYKEKLRLRSYGVPDEDTKIYVEIKKKFAGKTNKRRSTLMPDEAYAFLQTGVLPEPKSYQNRQVLSEIEYILHTHELHPALYLAYDRMAMFGIGQHDLRISFDRDIRTRRYDLRLEAGDYGSPLLEDGKWLMEVKTSQSIPVWLCRLLSEHKIYPTSFSKYGAEYKSMLENTKPARIISFAPEKVNLPFKVAANS